MPIYFGRMESAPVIFVEGRRPNVAQPGRAGLSRVRTEDSERRRCGTLRHCSAKLISPYPVALSLD